MARLRVIAILFFLILFAVGLPAGYYYSVQAMEGHEDQAEFWLGVVYGLVVAGFLTASLVTLKSILLNVVLFFRNDVEFDDLKIHILAVEGVVILILVGLLIYLLPMRFSDL